MEDELFFLAELWHVSPHSLMGIPVSRRKRFVDKKDVLERRREAQRKADAARSKTRRRR